MSEIDNIADRLIQAFYNNPEKCPYLVKLVFYCTSICAYRVIYEDDRVPNRFLADHSGEDYYIFNEIYNMHFSNDITELYHSDYTPQVPFDRYRYSIHYSKLYDISDISMKCSFAFRTYTSSDKSYDRYADYAIVMMLLLQEYKKHQDAINPDI